MLNKAKTNEVTMNEPVTGHKWYLGVYKYFVAGPCLLRYGLSI